MFITKKENIMEKVEKGLFVSINYKGTLENGEVFDSSHDCNPLEVEIGTGNLIQGFENALMGMALNETKTFTLTPEEAYGHVDKEGFHTFPKTDVPPEMNPQVGDTISLSSPDGQQIPARISLIDDEKVVVDLNHPLAGETLTFDIEVVAISNVQTQTAAGCGGDCSCNPDDGCSSGCS